MIQMQPNQSDHVLSGKHIGVFGKGGSGKSTSIVMLARSLQDRGYKVCVLDADSTNIGLSQAFGIEQPPTPLMEYFGGMVFGGGLVTCPVDDPMPLPGCEISLDILPRNYYAQNRAGITLLIAGKIGELGPGAGCDGPISKIARDLRISQHGEALLTLVDFKAGFEDTARGAITGLDWGIVLVDPTTASVEMAANMRDTVHQIKNGYLPATKHLEDPALVAMANKIFTETRIKGTLFILNKIKDKETESYLLEKLNQKDIQPIGVIREYPLISISWLKGTPLDIPEARGDMRRIIEKLEAVEKAYQPQTASAGSKKPDV